MINGQAIVNGEANAAANAAMGDSCGEPLPKSAWGSVSVDWNCNFPTPIMISPDHYFVMGDNRAFGKANRFLGAATARLDHWQGFRFRHLLATGSMGLF